jgi:hypothetical protein
MFYYSRTSNVDMPALFLTALALWCYAIVLRDGLSVRTAILLGTCSALAVATKDASYGAMVPVALVVLARHLRREPRLVVIAGVVAAVVYLVASGAIVNPQAFALHLNFILHGSTRHYQFYYGSTRSYAAVLLDTAKLLIDAMSPPVVVLAIAGFIMAARRSSRAWLWLLPGVGIVVLTILPVRFVLYRFVMISAYCFALFAAFALSSSRLRTPIRRALLILVCGWSAVRGLDLTWQMLDDSRYAAGAWFHRNARSGDRVGYYGTEPVKLPFLDATIEDVPGPSSLPAPASPEFLVVMPWQVYESVHEYNLPDATYSALLDGSAGYTLMLEGQTRALFPARPGSFVNPDLKVFVRNDRVAGLSDRILTHLR